MEYKHYLNQYVDRNGYTQSEDEFRHVHMSAYANIAVGDMWFDNSVIVKDMVNQGVEHYRERLIGENRDPKNVIRFKMHLGYVFFKYALGDAFIPDINSPLFGRAIAQAYKRKGYASFPKAFDEIESKVLLLATGESMIRAKLGDEAK